MTNLSKGEIVNIVLVGIVVRYLISLNHYSGCITSFPIL